MKARRSGGAGGAVRLCKRVCCAVLAVIVLHLSLAVLRTIARWESDELDHREQIAAAAATATAAAAAGGDGGVRHRYEAAVATPGRPMQGLTVTRAHTEGIEVAVLIMSRRSAAKRRDALRASWVQDLGMLGIPHRFAVGGAWCDVPSHLREPGLICMPRNGTSPAAEQVAALAAREAALDSALAQEQARHGDLLVLDGVVDSYGGLANKTLATLATAAAALRPAPRWLLKVDDDVVVRPAKLLATVRHMEAQDAKAGLAAPLRVVGSVLGGVAPATAGRYVERHYNATLYPSYPNGAAGYLVSRAVATALAERRAALPLLSCEDAAVGVWIAIVGGVELRSSTRMDAQCPLDCCLAVATAATAAAQSLQGAAAKRAAAEHRERRRLRAGVDDGTLLAAAMRRRELDLEQERAALGLEAGLSDADREKLEAVEEQMQQLLLWMVQLQKQRWDNVVFGHLMTPREVQQCADAMHEAEAAWEQRWETRLSAHVIITVRAVLLWDAAVLVALVVVAAVSACAAVSEGKAGHKSSPPAAQRLLKQGDVKLRVLVPAHVH